MRLQIHHVDRHQHQKTLVSACCWTPNNEIMTCADDHTIVKWKMNGECLGVVTTLPPTTFVTAMDWIPSVGSAKSELFAAACTDGGFRLFSATGREEKRVMGNGIIGHNPSSSSSSSGGGAIVTLKWNYDGSALATGSEDGHVRIWSRSGNLRSTLASTGKPVYALAWGPDNDELCYASGSDLVLKSSGGNSQSSKSKKPVAWVAHVGGVITALDWHPIHHRILSGGEDRVYRIWDVYGRQLYQSQACGHVITSLAWSPNGETFVVGAYDLLRLCDKAGWSYHQGESSSSSSSSTSTTLGCSLMALRWSRDGTQVCGAGGNGQVIFAQIVDRVVEWGSVTARLQSPHELHVLHENEHSSSNEEVLAFGREHRILDFQLGFGYLVVTTTSRQCHVYSVENWHTPHVFDVRVCPHLMLQSPSHVLLADVVTGITIYSYEGRVVSTPKFHGLAVEFLHPKTMSLSADTLSIVDRTSSSSSSGSKSKSNTSRSQNQPQPTDQPQQHHHHQCLIRHFDVTTGRPLSSTPVTHHALDILELSLNTFGPRQDRKILYLDINRDLFLQPLYTSQTSSGGHKLTSQVTSACWSDESDQLVAITDGQLMSWSYPSMVLVDKSLLALTCTHVGQGSAGASSSSSGTSLSKPETVMMNGGASMSSSSILSFVHTRVTLRRVDGALWTTAVSPYTLMLYRLMTTSDHRHHSGSTTTTTSNSPNNNWAQAIRLCRFVNTRDLWAAVAGLALASRHLESAEIALAALEQVEKLDFVLYVKSIPSEAGRNAALALYRHQVDEAEAILLQAQPQALVYRAIKMNLRLFRWTRALELAIEYKTHVDTVLGYRARYLEANDLREQDPRFLQYVEQVECDWSAISAKKALEREKEREHHARVVRK